MQIDIIQSNKLAKIKNKPIPLEIIILDDIVFVNEYSLLNKCFFLEIFQVVVNMKLYL